MITETSAPLRPTQLADIVSRLATRQDEWMPEVRLDPGKRWHHRLESDPAYDTWILSWLPGQGTGFHDHGRSAGAFIVVTGSLDEHRPDGRTVTLEPRGVRAFGPGHVHDVRNNSHAPAVSLHTYSPPLTDMTHYALDDGALRPLPAGEPGAGADGREGNGLSRPPGIAAALASARGRFGRVSALDAHAETNQGRSVLVDIRPVAQRQREGIVPGSLVVERNVLEWRFDPASASRLPIVTGYDLRPILLCSEGYASSLAAASLQAIGLWRATDVIGGFTAWRDAGLPVGRLSDVAVPAFETRGECAR